MKINKLLDDNYKLFSSYPIDKQLKICTCSLSKEEIHRLVSSPLREIDSDLLSRFIHSPSSESDDQYKEMKYFIPRILELIVEEDFPSFLPESLFNKLFCKNTFMGSTKEFEHLKAFFLEYFISYINRYPAKEPIETILIMLRRSDLHSLLMAWEKSKSVPAIRHFIDLINGLDHSPELKFLLNCWLNSPKVKQHFLELLEKLYFSGSLTDEEILLTESAYILYTTENPSDMKGI